jgi:hypothetical protein
MVVKRRLLPGGALALALVIAASVPALGSYGASKPDPLAKDSVVLLQDVAATTKAGGTGPVVAVGWRQGADPGSLFVAYSTNGARSFLNSNDVLRRFRVAGDGTRGLSLDICGGRIWAASVANYPGDDSRDRDVLLTSRTIAGVAGQAFVTQATVDRVVSRVSIACVGKKLVAIAWLERSGDKTRARLMLRSLEPLGTQAKVRTVFGLGEANVKGGIAVDAGSDSVHVSWTGGADDDLRYARFSVSDAPRPVIDREGTMVLASGGTRDPQIAARGPDVVVAYSDGGKVKVRLSGDHGASFGEPELLIGTGTVRSPSRAYSVDRIGSRIVLEAAASKDGTLKPRRIESTNAGGAWVTRGYGHNGARMGALWKSGDASRLAEAWQNNAPGDDTLRAQYER